MMASRVLTASIGDRPTAVSPDSMIASTPSSTALAASLTSARVGRGSKRIDSSTCVATITGTPALRARRVRCFWSRGTCSSGTSRPRSPRATMMASATLRIESISSTACGRSILATSPTALPAASTIDRACSRSCAVCTKLTATRSTPRERPNSRSRTSLSVKPDSVNDTPGALIPLCSPSSPPCTTVALIS